MNPENSEIVRIRTPFIKLDAFLKFAGAVGTGGQASMLIADGLVLVDGEVCLQRGKKLYPGMTVELEGQRFEVASLAG